MYVVNSNAGCVPFGKYAGFDLYELVQTDPSYARWMLNKTNLRQEFPDEYYDLEMMLASAELRRGMEI